MAILHIIDVARVAHETARRYFASTTTNPAVTATWGDLPQAQRDLATGAVQKIIDGQEFAAANELDRLGIAIVEALRPFVEE